MRAWAVKKLDVLGWTENLDRIPGGTEVRRRAVEVFIKLGIPFNRFLGLRVAALTLGRVEMILPDSFFRQNQIGSAHACAIAILGETPASLLVAQTYSPKKYRGLVKRLDVDYIRPGHGELMGETLAPEEWPAVKDGQCTLELKTMIRNSDAQDIAICRTTWQIQEW